MVDVSIIRLSLSSNWTELDWTGTELGNRASLSLTGTEFDWN